MDLFTQYMYGLAFVYNGDQYLYLLMAVIPFAVDYCDRVCCFGYDTFADGFVHTRKDDELDILSGAVHHHVKCIGVDGKRT